MAFMPIRQSTTQSPVVCSLPRTISSYYHPKYQKYTHKQQSEECDRIFKYDLKITEEEAKYLAETSQLQSQSSVWWEHKRGHLTSSKFLAICRTSVVSLLNHWLMEYCIVKQLLKYMGNTT